MKHGFQIAWAFIVHSIQRETAFRSNFFVNALNTSLNVAAGLGGLWVLFSHTNAINGWERGQTQMVLGVYLLVQALKNLVIGPSLSRLAGLDGDLWTGNFDFTLLKPVPTQWYVSIQSWSMWALIDVGAASWIIVWAWRLQTEAAVGSMIPLRWAEWLGFAASLFIGLGLLYGILLFLASAAFWYLGTPMMWIFDSMFQLGRFPIRLYPVGLENLLTWIVPVGFIVTVPAEWLSGDGSPMLLLGGVIMLVLLWSGSSRFFYHSLRRYSSASS